MYVKIHIVVIEAGGISSALNTLDPFWSRSWKFPNIASELRVDIDHCSQVPLSANAYNCNRRSTLLSYALELRIQMPYKRHARHLGLQKWLCNSIIYSTSCETDKRTPSTGWYHWHSSLHRNASIMSVLLCIIAASALCENFVPTNESRCPSRSSTNSSKGSQILSS